MEDFVPSEPNPSDKSDFTPHIKSFKTERGSEYIKQPDGTFIRHKYNGETYHEDLTLFINSETYFPEREIKNYKGEVFDTIHTKEAQELGMKMNGQNKEFTPILVQPEFDEAGKPISNSRDIIRDKSQIKNPKYLAIAIIDKATGKESETPVFVSTEPKQGDTVFEFSFGNPNSEYNILSKHFGDKVSSIEEIPQPQEAQSNVDNREIRPPYEVNKYGDVTFNRFRDTIELGKTSQTVDVFLAGDRRAGRENIVTKIDTIDNEYIIAEGLLIDLKNGTSVDLLQKHQTDPDFKFPSIQIGYNLALGQISSRLQTPEEGVDGSVTSVTVFEIGSGTGAVRPDNSKLAETKKRIHQEIRADKKACEARGYTFKG
ncbi:hypothetical protein FWF89_03230 [Candidatus Saccharibacteria bacterium]|nr:hypothetical protein [Candidatus Saccharibacteria bacterium]